MEHYTEEGDISLTEMLFLRHKMEIASLVICRPIHKIYRSEAYRQIDLVCLYMSTLIPSTELRPCANFQRWGEI